jgi:filamentous hemagglutinin family protein
MNVRCFKTVFCQRLGSLVAVGEHACSQGKATGASTSAHSTPRAAWGLGFCGVLSTTLAFVTLAWASPAWAQPQVQPATHALPTGGQVVQGAVQFNTQAQQLNITQSTDRAAVNWQSFDIGSQAKVQVQQPSAQSVLLNRVGGEAPSQIFGQLQANGKVILVNPNGLVIGRDGSVNAAGFTGSTLNISDADFMAGQARFSRSGAAHGSVLNQGRIEVARGGYVALLGASVSNEGAIVAPQGQVFLAAADGVKIPSEQSGPALVSVPLGTSGRIRLELTPASINAAVANHKGGTIVTEGGQVYLQAAAVNAALASVLQSGSIDTTGVKGGQVHVLADGGHIRVDGNIKANSTGTDEKGQQLAGGDIYMGRDKDTNVLAAVGDSSGATLESKGGFVETSGSFLKTDGTRVIAKDWLLDPSDITISTSANSNVTGISPADITPNGGDSTSSIVQVSTIEGAINSGTNVTIKTTNALNPTGAGNITIADALSFNNTGAQAATLSLIADNGITQNAAITGTGTQLVNISMTANGNFQGNTAASANSRGITLNAGITTNGNITLTGNNQSGAGGGTGAGVYINRQTLNAGASDVTITGTATNGSGILVLANSTIRGRDITIQGTAHSTLADSSTLGGVFVLNTDVIRIEASRNLGIIGTVEGTGLATGGGTRNGLRISTQLVGVPIAALMTAGGTATLRGIQRGNANNTSSAMYLSGFRVNATGDVTLQAEAANSNSLAIHMNREAGALNGYDDWRMQVRSSGGNVLIQSSQGAVLGQDINGGVNISGRNVTLDNTGAGMTVNSVANANGGSIHATTGAIVLGSGTSTFATSVSNGWAGSWVPLGVSLASANSTASVTASGNLTLGGSSSAAQGLVVGNAVSAGANIYLASRASAASTIGLSITQALTAAGSIGLTGESTHATTPGVGLNVGAAIGTTGNSSTTTLTSTTGSVSGTGNITTAVGNTGSITVNAATAGTLSGVISGGGSLVKQGAGTTTLTGNNSYTGTTTISAGTLQIGNATTTGTLGSGAVTNNAVLTFNRSNAMTVGNAISGTGNLNQTGAGTTTLTSNNSYGGTTTISGGTLQIGSGGATGTLGVGDVTLSNGANLNFVRNTSTSIDNNISGNGNVNANITGTGSNLAMNSSIALSGATGSQTNNAILSTTGSITQSAGSIAATNLFLTATNGGIATAGNRIISNVSNLAMASAGDQFATQSSALRLAARTTGGGHIDVLTTQGTLTVESVNGVNGVSASGSGTITLSGTSNTADGLVIATSRPVTSSTGNLTLSGTATGANGTGLNIGFNGSISTGGNVSLTGNTAANNRTAGTFAAVTNAGTVSGSNITLTALASNTTADVLGYYGANGTLVATQNLTANTESRGAGVGFYMFDGRTQSGTGMSITATGNTESAIGLDSGAQVLNKVTAGAASGNLVLTGSSNSTVSSSVGLYRAVIENAGTNGGVQISATQGDVRANYGQANTITNGGSSAVVLSAGPSLATDAGAINGTDLTITQNGNGGVQVLTSGTGNVTTPKIVNAGTGNVTVAAGTQLAAGNGTGGQIRTVSGNTITQTNAAPGKTYIYTGNASDTGVLSNLGAFGAALYLSTIGANTKNAASNRTYADGPITGGANAQVMFREKLAFTGVLNDATVTYGITDSASLKTALQTANPSGGTPGTFTQISNAGNLQLLVVDVVADSTSTMTTAQGNAANLSSSGQLKASTTPYRMDLVGAQYNLTGITANALVNKRVLTGVTIAAAGITYGSAVTPGALSFAGSNRVSGDQIGGTVSVVSTAADLSSSGNLRAGSYMQTAGSTLSGLDQGNYIFAGVNSSTANYVVARRGLSADIAGVTTSYGTTAATAQASISGQVTGDQVFWTGGTSLVGAVYSSSNRLRAGTYQQTADGVLGGADAGNYTTSATAAANYVVTPRVINASVTAADKVYDGSVAASLVASSADILLGDVVNVTGLTGSFASRNVARDGTGNVLAQAVTVSGSGAALGGADGANYVLGNAASVPATTARITPRELSVSGITASDKVYDGNTTAVVSAVTAVLRNAVAGDSVAVSTQNAQGNFADKDVARDAKGQVLAKAVQVSGLQLQGSDAGNYSLQTSGVSAQASITPRPVSLSGNSAVDKVADGTTAAQVIAGSLNGLVAGESLNVNAQGEFEDALVGTNKAVNARFALQNGALGLASNYQLSNPVEVLRASIVAFVPGKVSPEPIGGGSTQGSRVSFGGGPSTGAATGVNDDPVDPVVAQCSVLNPEKCECVETPQPGVELCFVPVQRVSLKD